MTVFEDPDGLGYFTEIDLEDGIYEYCPQCGGTAEENEWEPCMTCFAAPGPPGLVPHEC